MHTEGSDANPQCGRAHPSRRDRSCDMPRGHERIAHAETTTTLDASGFTQETISWVDWSDLDEHWHTLTMRETTRAQRVRAKLAAQA